MSAFRLPSGATAPYAKLAGACMEIVFVGIRLCDRLKNARLNALYSAMPGASRGLGRGIRGRGQVPEAMQAARM